MQLPNRRQVLAGGIVGLVTACTQHRTAARVPPDSDTRLLIAASSRERALIEAYDAVILAQPRLAVRLASLRGDHLRHEAALTGTAEATAAPTPTQLAAEAHPNPAAEHAALARLAAMEHAVAKEHALASVIATRSHAPLLASLAACESAHAVLL